MSAVPLFDVVIIGSGFGGLGTAVRLQQEGQLSFTVLEKEAGVGGTWYLNMYPGGTLAQPCVRAWRGVPSARTGAAYRHLMYSLESVRASSLGVPVGRLWVRSRGTSPRPVWRECPVRVLVPVRVGQEASPPFPSSKWGGGWGWRVRGVGVDSSAGLGSPRLCRRFV
jgi:hypothetical protein